MRVNFIRLFFEYLYIHIKSILFFIIFTLIFAVVSYLSNLSLSNILYASLLCVFTAVIFMSFDLWRFYKKHELLIEIQNQITVSTENLPPPYGLMEKDYIALIKLIHNDKLSLLSSKDKSMSDMIDYYTLWAHQIKTPIAAMRLLIQSDNKNDNTELKDQLQKIEQYVEMVLSYLRLDSDTTDFVLKEYDIFDIVKQSVRKYAHLFIKKKIILNLEETSFFALTDEKWLSFAIEQILSNALKYTKEGYIAIYLENNTTLVIKDTGIGIAQEDLPRVFEKGFTGYNGRYDKKSTGIGLYLCKRILLKLGHTISITSRITEGTEVKINFKSSVNC